MFEITEQEIDNIIGVYNRRASINLQYKSKPNREAVKLAAQSAKDYNELWNYVYDHAKREVHITALMQQFRIDKAAQGAPQPQAQSPAPTQPVASEPRKLTAQEQGLSSAMDVLAGAVTAALGQVKKDEIGQAVIDEMKEELRKFIKDEYGPITKKVKVEMGEKKVEIEGVLHKEFTTVLGYVMKNEPVFLYGPAGTGKNHLCQQVAKALGLNFYFSNAVTQEYQLLGFTDANGNYQKTQFYEAMKNGGLFMLDEADASNPEVMVKLNAAIANRYMDFPAPIGRVDAHPNLRFIAAGNTTGNGASYQYVGRNQLDAATLNRFGYVEIDYDPAIEKAMADGDEDLLGFCRAFRKATADAGIIAIVSYREIERMANLKGVLDTPKLIKTALVKGLEKQDLRMIKDKVQGYGDYSVAFEKLC